MTGVRPVKIRKKTALSPTMPRKTRIGVLLEPETDRRCMGRERETKLKEVQSRGNRRKQAAEKVNILSTSFQQTGGQDVLTPYFRSGGITSASISMISSPTAFRPVWVW